MTHSQGERKPVELYLGEARCWTYLGDKDYKSAVTNIFKVLKEICLKNKGKYDNFISPRREINKYKLKYEMEILWLKSITEIKISPDRLSDGSELAE